MSKLIVLGSGDDFYVLPETLSVLAGTGQDTLVGTDGDDALAGEDGNDSLVGGAGSDVLQGGAGENILIGGSDGDIFTLDRPLNGGIALQQIQDFQLDSDLLGLAPGLSFSELEFSLEPTSPLVPTLSSTSDDSLAGRVEQPTTPTPPVTLVKLRQTGETIARIVGVQPGVFNSDRVISAETLEFAASQFTVREDGSSVLPVVVTRSFPYLSAQFITTGVKVLYVGDTASVSQDMQGIGVSVGFDPGARSLTVPIEVNNDGLAEPTETLFLQLADPTGNGRLGSRQLAQLTILDSGAAPQPNPGSLSLSSSSYSADESELFLTVDVVRTGGSSGEVSASLVTSNESAIAGQDYIAATEPAVVRFADGDTTPKTARLFLLDNTRQEADKTLRLSLADLGGGASLGTGAAQVTILDNDAPAGVLAFSEPTFQVSEGQAAAIVTVSRSGGSTGAISAQLVFRGGSATPGLDYPLPSGPFTVAFADGDTTPKTIALPLSDDALLEDTESLNLLLVNPSGGATLGRQQTAVVNIADNDRTVARFDFTGQGDLVPVGTDPVTGIGFSSNALSIANYDSGGSGNFLDPLLAANAPATALTYGEGDSIILNVPQGWRDRLAFRYAAPFALDPARSPDGLHEVSLYSGPNGTGDLLARVKLPSTADTQAPVGAYGLTKDLFTIAFAGIARSARLGSQADKLVLDDVAIG